MPTVTVDPSELDDIIKERKAMARRRAEDKRLNDLEYIRLQNTKREDGHHPLKILPKEMWEAVFNFLVTPVDLENTRLCCPLFMEILEPRRIRDILLPMALDVNVFRKKLRLQTSDPDNGMQLLLLRRVCRSTRNLVDRCIEDYIERKKLVEDDEFPIQNLVTASFFLECMDDQSIEELKHLLDVYNPDVRTSAKRFVFKSIRVRHSSLYIQDFWEKLACFKNLFFEVLLLIGEQVVNFEFETCSITYLLNKGLKLSELYTMIQEWVTLMPNLQFLKLSLSGTWSPLSSELSSDSVEDAIERRSFQTLPNLKKLHFKFHHNDIVQTALIFESVLISNPHLKKVSVQGRINESTARFVRLVHTLQLDSFTFITDSPTPIEDAHSLVNRTCKLKEVKLSCRARCTARNSLFQFLEGFPTVEKLHLKMTHGDMRAEDDLRFLQLPKLTEFHFFYGFGGDERKATDIKFALCVDHLLKAELLQKLTWVNFALNEFAMRNGTASIESYPLHEVIQFNAGTVDIRASNLWKVFPLLEKLELPNLKDGHSLREEKTFDVYTKWGTTRDMRLLRW